MEKKKQESCGCGHGHYEHHEHNHDHGCSCHHEDYVHTCTCDHEHHNENSSCSCGHEHHHHHQEEMTCGCGHEHHEHMHDCHQGSCDCGHDHHAHTHDHRHHGDCGCGHDHHGSHHDHGCGCGCGHDHNHEQDPAEVRRELMILGIGVALLAAGILLSGVLRTALLLAAFVIVAWDIVLGAIKNIRHGDVFGENFLMTIAGIGAVCIGEIPEGVLVFLLYRFGEYLQTKAVSSSRKSISALLDVRPDKANLMLDGQIVEIKAKNVDVGQTILVRPGEKIPLDGTVLAGNSQIDTAALTGESLPREVVAGHSVMAGCINLSGALEVRVDKAFGESTASKILEMVEHASEKKAASEKFITRFARVYTPIVVMAAVLVAVVPALLSWMEWGESFYSALCFLAISCPCALVISVPLSFFAGIGRASREGILVKGGNHLETMAQAEIIGFDKTGTLTAGKFSVSKCEPANGVTKEELLRMAAVAESRSNHPIALSIVASYYDKISDADIREYKEISGHGVSVLYQGQRILAGRADHLRAAGIEIPENARNLGTTVYVARDDVFCGAIILRDEPKSDAKAAVSVLKTLGIKKTVMLSGDNNAVAREIGTELGLDSSIGELLPTDKLHELEHLRGELSAKGKLLYAGDGINDTPVLAAADIGIAMGGLGADAAIETADVIIMGDEPSKISAGIKIARLTRRIATENIVFSIATKVLVMLLSVFGHVELWMAVFADVGVCMLCVLNTLRINRK